MYSFDFLFGELDEQTYNIIWGILQVLGILLGGCLTVKYLTESILVQDGIESKFLITLLIHSTTFQ